MAFKRNFSLLLAFLLLVENTVSATVFIFQNSCNYTVWPGTLSGNGGAILGDGGFLLAGASMNLTVQPSWSGRFWPRTGCNFDDSGNGHCTTGDCGKIKCTGNGEPPATLAEFTIGSDNSKLDFYDVSLVDGYNAGMGVKPTGGTGACQYAGCVADLNVNCPADLKVMESGTVVACKSACAAFNSSEYCCTGDHSTPQTCSPTPYSKIFKAACPSAYSYAYDDASSTCTCAGSDYVITFCPSTAS
ncbi:hypothetical protein NE237_023911 [Protea cynaroides]|uniref:Pathogenesis-related protein 5-like n=1 Tax=Protea cynaroides TaxID=273540 RepID=A0A9Q0HH50_9MAGN|nr:hypothetical protein NE237_023911 [Protea cynaroides]